jgi:hypothetical protein
MSHRVMVSYVRANSWQSIFIPTRENQIENFHRNFLFEFHPIFHLADL